MTLILSCATLAHEKKQKKESNFQPSNASQLLFLRQPMTFSEFPDIGKIISVPDRVKDVDVVFFGWKFQIQRFFNPLGNFFFKLIHK